MLDAVTPPSQPPSSLPFDSPGLAQGKPPVDFQKIIDENRYPDPGLTPEQQTAFTHRYSFAALIWQFVYYFAMGDQLLAWLSLGCSVIFFLSPLLLFFPIWARRRAFSSKQWLNFNEFYYAQKRWDKTALYLTVVSVVLLLISFWLIGPMILNSFHVITGQTDSGAGFTQQLQDTVQQYQDILGQ